MDLQQRIKQAGETVNCGMNMSAELASDETITGTPTVTGSPSGLTINNISVITEQTTIDGRRVAIGQGVLFRIAGGTADTTYTITVTCSTDAGQVRIGNGYLLVE